MHRLLRLLICAAVSVVATAVVSTPAHAYAVADSADHALTPATIEASLRGEALARWKSLPTPKKALTVKILSDRYFGLPSAAERLQQQYPDLEVKIERSDQVAEQTMALTTVTRTSWVRQYWTILGITYTEVKTTMGYKTSGSVVTGVNRCYGTYVNYVPLRSIDHESWYTLGNGLADCWTEWTLGRPLQPTVTGYQGLRVDGWGNILKVWYV